jgi:hypothetical protein
MAKRPRLGRGFRDIGPPTQDLEAIKKLSAQHPGVAGDPKGSIYDGQHAMCPRCRKPKGGWPDEWRNDISLPGRQVQYVCADCYQAALPSPEVLKVAIRQWAYELHGKLLIPHELVETSPYQAIELLHSALGVAYEEARLLRNNALLIQQADKEKSR